MKIKNIAIIAHVDHGKTTLVDCLLRQGGVFKTHELEKVEERKLALEEVYEAYDNGKLEEVFLCGTAAVIAPVGELFDGTKKLELITDNKPGEWTQKIYNLLTGIQLGKVEDKFGWVVKVED